MCSWGLQILGDEKNALHGVFFFLLARVQIIFWQKICPFSSLQGKHENINRIDYVSPIEEQENDQNGGYCQQ
jgi:hypothetical protein